MAKATVSIIQLEYFRQQAVEYRRMAACTEWPDYKRAFLDIAATFERLADDVDRPCPSAVEE